MVSRALCRSLALAFSALLLSACMAEQDALPRPRLGALPFPGLFTLYTSSDVSEVGLHHYTSWWERPFQEGEGARGIMYTCQAGFLDLAHLHEGVDWTRYMRDHARTLLLAGGGSVSLVNDDTHIELSVSLPPWWAGLSDSERETLTDEAALCMGERAAYQIAVWHEIVTWFGWRTFFFIPEDVSSFTWEDLNSDLLGVIIGGQVVRDGDQNYDRRASAAVRSMLMELGPVSTRWVDRAAYAVEGQWWRDGVAVRRDLDTGLETGFKVPWLVPGLECCPDCEPVTLTVPSLKNVNGHDLSSVYELRLTAPTWLLERMYAHREPPRPIVADRDYAGLIDLIRTQMQARWGPDVDRPTVRGAVTRQHGSPGHPVTD